MHLPSVMSAVLMLPASFKRDPVALVLLYRSLPAKSTMVSRLITVPTEVAATEVAAAEEAEGAEAEAERSVIFMILTVKIE